MNLMPLTKNELIKEAVLRIGEVSEIDGRTVYITVDKNKNASDLLFEGKIIKNISVGSYIKIRKGFLSIIGKIESEKLKEEIYKKQYSDYETIDNNKRILTVNLCGYIDFENNFFGGIKELPLIGNEVFILTESKIHTIHNLLKKETPLKIIIAKTDIEDISISLPIDGLFNSHTAIFGNTGSGKSNTLAALYQEMISVLSKRKGFTENCKFFFFDFNGEYVKIDYISNNKTVYNLSTSARRGNKIPIKFDDLIDIENLSVLFEANEKTQKPFLNRTLKYYVKVKKSDDPLNYFKNILKREIKNVLRMNNKEIAFTILDYIDEILHYFFDEDYDFKIDIGFHDTNKYLYLIQEGVAEYNCKFIDDASRSEQTIMYSYSNNITQEMLDNISKLNEFYIFVLLKLISDLSRFKVQLEHILPVINRFKSKRKDIERIFNITDNAVIWTNNIVVVNLHDGNLDMKKCYHYYW